VKPSISRNGKVGLSIDSSLTGATVAAGRVAGPAVVRHRFTTGRYAARMPGSDARLDEVIALLASMSRHRYGERVDMLDHSLQTAARAAADDADDDLVVAALLHDIGHVLGEAGDWGLADHAQVGADYLSGWLPATVVEPIRLHVEAKRYLVATDREYRQHLGEASIMSLREQGGPMTDEEAQSFLTGPFAPDAVRLRRWDDDGKVVGDAVPTLDDARRVLARLQGRPSTRAKSL